MIVEIKDLKFFRKIIKMFSSNHYITFRIDSTNLQLKTSDIHTYFFNLEPSFFATDMNIEFTVNAKYMHKFVEIMNDNTLQIEDNFLVNKFTFNHAVAQITLPFISTINEDYHKLDVVKTKILVKNAKILGSLRGIVTYTIQNDGLVLTSTADEVLSEIFIYNVDVIEDRNLNFCCSNSWTSVFDTLSDDIESVLMCFDDNILMVQFLFREFGESYFEIQVPQNIL